MINWIIDIKVYATILEEEFPLNCADLKINGNIIHPGTYKLEFNGTEEQLDQIIEKMPNDVKIFGAHRINPKVEVTI